jgi:hypothetical protein
MSGPRETVTPFTPSLRPCFWYVSLLNIEHAKKIKFQLSEQFYFWEFQ